MVEKIGIVGAGIAGVTAARNLNAAGNAVTLFEKSRGVGGRLSTRRTTFGSFDHGAQYVSAKGEPFRQVIDALSKSGAVSLWSPDGQDRTADWHVGTPGMSSMVKPGLKNVGVKTLTRIVRLNSETRGVACIDENGASETFDRVIIAIPSPQAHELLAPVDLSFDRLKSVMYMPCWTSMFAFDKRCDRLPDFFRGEDTQAISWLARNKSKPDRDGVETICAQAGALWSKENLNRDQSEVLSMMHDAMNTMAGSMLAPIYSEAHRWRYARVDQPMGTPFLSGCNGRAFAIGDGMLGGRAEAAFESARQLCEYLKK